MLAAAALPPYYGKLEGYAALGGLIALSSHGALLVALMIWENCAVERSGTEQF